MNEFSQGSSGAKEYIELLVLGKKTCSDSTADLRGWIFDDQNGWYGSTHSAPGHYRFRNDLNWEKVPYGSLILIYNSAAGEKNFSIRLADDPTDADKNYTYVLPINSADYLEQHNTEPGNPAGLSYSYPPPSSTLGYVPSTNQWQFRISLNNDGDVISTVSPQDRSKAYFSIGFGYPILPGFRQPTVSIVSVPAGNNAFLSDKEYTSSESWVVSAVGENETPGLPNGGMNSAWIASLRQPYAALEEVETISGCGPVYYKGSAFSASTIVRDTIKSTVTTCDSILRTVNIIVHQRPQLSVSPDTTICKGSSVELVASANNARIEWMDIGPGNPILVSPGLTTVYTAIATSAAGCMDTARTTVRVSDLHLKLSAEPNPAIAGTFVRFTSVADSPFEIISWSPVGVFPNQTAFAQNLVADTSLVTTLTGRSHDGCMDTASIFLRVDPAANDILIPSAFTPNGDGRNDVLRVLGGRIQQLDFTVYNRWGQIVFSSKDRSRGWDGRYEGHVQPSGVYIYFAKAVLEDHTVVSRKGTVNLIK